jgi:hypothetical protein
MPKPPPHIKIRRAKAIVDDAGRKVLAECVSCGKYRYIVEGRTVCDECRSKRGKRKVGSALALLNALSKIPGRTSSARCRRYWEFVLMRLRQACNSALLCEEFLLCP